MAKPLDLAQRGHVVHGRRNLIINGAMQVAQRGTTVSGGTGRDSYGLDRFVFEGTDEDPISTQVAHSNSQITDGNRNALKISTTGTAIGSAQVHQRIERETFRHTIEQTVTFSCLVKRNSSTVTGGTLRMIASVNQNDVTYVLRDTPGTYPSHTVTEPLVSGVQNIPTDYTRYTASFTMPEGANTTDILEIGLSFISFTGAGATEDLFSITEMQLELGETATPFEHRSYAEELALCQRYYYKTGPFASGAGLLGSGHMYNTTAGYASAQFPVTMRDRPTAVETTGTATDYLLNKFGVYNNVASSVPTYNGATCETSWTVLLSYTPGATAGDHIRLRPNTTSAYLAWSAEL